MVRSYDIPLLSMRMVHEFLITEKYAIVPDLPVEFNPEEGMKHKRWIFHYSKDQPARYGIWPRNSPDGKDIKWFEVEPHYCFHYGGCWDTINEKGEEIVTLYAVVMPNFYIGLQYKEHLVDDTYEGNRFEKFEFNISTLQVKRTILFDNLQTEFPNLNQFYYGYKCRYCYLAYRPKKYGSQSLSKTENSNILFSGVLKFDMQEDKIVKQSCLGEDLFIGEIYYH